VSSQGTASSDRVCTACPNGGSTGTLNGTLAQCTPPAN
jgi:hypothetical protein